MTKAGFLYGVKRFCLYWIVGTIASCIPLGWLGLLFGFPSVLIGATFLSVIDAVSFNLDTSIDT